ncbi:VanZ family protein [Streptomyces radicis]|uniref:VanZ family protein n=1 Tax=Streptomyces radicis TaxID=1750517 RepID=UPI001C7E073D|nr:VanZ family protein [Streptomyces radicis]
MQHHPAGSTGPEAGPRPRLAALTLLLAYLVGVAWLALRPLDVLWVSPANLQPLVTIRADVERGPAEALRTIGAGMLRLAPLGVLLPLLGKRLGGPRFASLIRTGFVGGMIALAIEGLQTLVPSRVADVDTVILNTLGIMVAHQLCYALLRARVLGERPGHGVWLPAQRRRSPAREAAPERHMGRGRARRHASALATHGQGPLPPGERALSLRGVSRG